MFIKLKIAVLFLFMVSMGFSQTAISGFLNLEDARKPLQEIQLSQISLEDIPDYGKAKKIATARIAENGFFKFEKEHITDKEAIYYLSYSQKDKETNDSLSADHLFLLSNRDSIHFGRSEKPFANYRTTNLADKEWQRLRSFERRMREGKLKKEDSLSNDYAGDLKAYAKDSLQILLVKLIGIKQLDTKQLLERDITKNPNYYKALLAELKESDIERSDYLFLENKLSFLTVETVRKKYATSKIINILLVLAIAGLLVYVIVRRKNKGLVLSDLSRQERNVRGLILEGKSNKEIANELFISLSTVKTHITNIYSKLQVANRKELLQKARNS